MMSCCICGESLKKGDSNEPFVRVTKKADGASTARSKPKQPLQSSKSESQSLSAHVKCCMLFDSCKFSELDKEEQREVQVHCKRKVQEYSEACLICGKQLGTLSLDNYIRKCAFRYDQLREEVQQALPHEVHRRGSPQLLQSLHHLRQTGLPLPTLLQGRRTLVRTVAFR